MSEDTTTTSEPVDGNVDVTTPTEVNEFQSKYEKLAGLERYVDALGGVDKLIEVATTGYRLNNDPGFVEQLKQAWMPTTPTETPTEEEYYDPEVKSVHGKFAPEIERLKSYTQQLEAKVTGLESERYRETVSARMETVLSSFKDDPGLLKEATETLNSALASATAQQLEALNRPGGDKTLKMMLIDQYEKLATTPRKSVEAETPPVLPKATDPRHVTRAALPANTVGVPSGQKVTNTTVQRILEDVTRKVTGKDPAVFWQ